MFNGFALTDLNEQFAQFTANLTNLDTLQGGAEANAQAPTSTSVEAPAPAPAPAPASAPSYESVSNSDTIRSWGKIASQPMFGFSCAIATMAHTVMITLMSNVTLAIDESGYGFNTAVLVLELHFFFMFAPGFFTASLLERYGSYRVSLLGSLASALSVVVLAVDGGLVGYVIGMMLNGLGWNLSFSAGTVMLTSCYSETEATEVQGLNDFIIFSVAGSASLLSGLLYGAEGWKVLVYTVGGLVLINLAFLTTAHTYVADDAAKPEEPRLISRSHSNVGIRTLSVA